MVEAPARVALVGCGAVAERYYAPALRALCSDGTLTVTALVDIEVRRTAHLAACFPDAARLTHWGKLAGLEPDLVIVASPPRHHAEQVCGLLRTGHSVLCEKPLAPTAAEAEAVLRVADAAPGLLALGLSRRFFPAIAAIDRILSAGWLGRIQSFRFVEGHVFDWPVASPAYFDKQESQGVLMDIGSHALDLVRHWFGDPERLEYADDAMGGIEANCKIEMLFASSTRGIVQLSREHLLENRYRIDGTDAWLCWPVNETTQLQIGTYGSTDILDTRILTRTLAEMTGNGGENFEASFARQVRHVIQAMRGHERLRVTGAQGLAGLRMIERCYGARTLMPMPWFDAGEWARALKVSAAG